MRLALYQPDIPQNAGALLRLCACLGIGLDMIGPMGFVMDDQKLKRVGMDYVEMADMVRHSSWDAFLRDRRPGRLLLLTTKGAVPYCDFSYRPDDCLILGRESKGAPEKVHDAADAALLVPMRPGLRSLNVAMTAAIVAGEALRQTGGFSWEAR